jgi:ABC-type taurine transport system ATPase subunit
MVNVECVGHVNRLIRTDKIKHFMMLSQALHNKKIVQIANRIHEAVLRNQKIVVLIAGPTASGSLQKSFFYNYGRKDDICKKIVNSITNFGFASTHVLC